VFASKAEFATLLTENEQTKHIREEVQYSVAKKSTVNAVVLAGGEGTRMRGADKPFVQLEGKPLLAHVLQRLEGRVESIVLSVNHDAARFSEYGLPTIEDCDFSQKSPLLGIYSALKFFAERSEDLDSTYLFCVPVDVPIFPETIIEELVNLAIKTESGISYTQVGEQPQPLFAVWSLSSLKELQDQLRAGAWGVISTLQQLNAEVLYVPESDGLDFANINSPEELQDLREQYRRK